MKQERTQILRDWLECVHLLLCHHSTATEAGSLGGANSGAEHYNEPLRLESKSWNLGILESWNLGIWDRNLGSKSKIEIEDQDEPLRFPLPPRPHWQ